MNTIKEAIEQAAQSALAAYRKNWAGSELLEQHQLQIAVWHVGAGTSSEWVGWSFEAQQTSVGDVIKIANGRVKGTVKRVLSPDEVKQYIH